MATRKTVRQFPTMADATRNRLAAQLADPNVTDCQNPAFLFSTTTTDLLLAIAGGHVDPVALARRELANRGLDQDGNWIGHDRADDLWGVQR